MHPAPLPIRRGISTVATVLLLVTVQLVIVGLVLAGARDDDLTVRRLNTVQAFYAAEAGMNMAMREMMLGADEDVDGGVGTIASTGVGLAQVVVTSSTAGGQTTLTSAGTAGAARREIDATTE